MVAHLAETLLEAHVDAAEAVLEGREPPVPGLGGRRAALRARATTGDTLKVSEAGERYLAERTRDAKRALSQQTAAQARTTFRLFAEFTDDAPLDAVTRRDASEFLDALATLHRHYGRHPGAAGLPLEKLVRRYPAGDGDGLSNRTLNRHLSALSGLWRWARRRGHLPDDRPNPYSDRSAAGRRQSLFAIRHRRAERAVQGLDLRGPAEATPLPTARPWIMATAVYSGMRGRVRCAISTPRMSGSATAYPTST